MKGKLLLFILKTEPCLRNPMFYLLFIFIILLIVKTRCWAKAKGLILSSINLPFFPQCSVQFYGVACVFDRFYYCSVYVRYTYLNLVLHSFSLHI